MILIHSLGYWLLPQYKWLYSFVGIIGDASGANTFIFLSGLTAALSYNAQKRRADIEFTYSAKHRRVNYFIKSLILLLIAVITNIVGSLVEENSLQVWIWYVLLTISIARLLCYPLLKYPPGIRMIVGITFFIFADPLRNYLSSSSSFLYYFFYNPIEQNTPFPFFGFFFIGSAVGDWLYFRKHTTDFTEKTIKFASYLSKPSTLVLLGSIFVSFGILTGLDIHAGEVAQYQLFWINQSESFHYDGILMFLVRGTSPWSFYTMGVIFLILSLFIYFDERASRLIYIRNYEEWLSSKILSRISSALSLFGQYSLTVYIAHYALIGVFNSALPIIYTFIAFGVGVVLIYWFLRFSAQVLRSYITFEWLLRFTANFAVRKLC
jgi:hypothetical protein